MSAVNPGEERDSLHALPQESEFTAAPPSPTITRTRNNRARSNSAASHVDVGFFDPEGVRDLRRTVSRMSEAQNNPTSIHDGKVLEPESRQALPHQASSNTASSSSSQGVTSDETLLPEKGFDLARTLRIIQKRREEADIKPRELGVHFRDLKVVGLGASASYMPTLGSMLNPLNMFGNIQKLRHPPLRDILSGFHGVVRPGEMLLVLGRPGSGSTTLLKVLANQTDEFHDVSGERHYDSLTPEQVNKHYRGDVLYCPEDDVHFPSLTVQQTLSFATKTRVPQRRVGDAPRKEFVNTTVEILETIFGLRHVKNTPVGDASIRGVSGGEKKRVSISEALATRSRLNSWDNSTRGLDASTALEFVRALRIATDISRLSTICSIYQAGEQLYKHFDKVCVIYEGRMAYFGPADRARQYFIDMGYEPENRQTTADFLVSVTDPNGRNVRSGIDPRSIPHTATEFAAAFEASELGKLNAEDMGRYENEYMGSDQRASAFKASAREEHARHTRPKSPYTISIPMQARAVMMRRVQILRGTLGYQTINMATFIIQGIIMGTVFLNIPDSTSAYFSRGGVLFFALLFSALNSMAEIPSLYAQRPIVLRHYKAAMYHPFIEAIALTLVDIPITLVILSVFSVILYFLVGLQRTAGQFFIFLLFLFTMGQVMKAYFRMLAAAFKAPASAQTFAGVSLLLLVLYTGYTVPRPSMVGGLRWISYINPLRYGFEGVLANEFHTLDGTCASLVPSGPGYTDVSIQNQVCSTAGSIAGQSTVNGNRYLSISYGFSYSNLWRNFGIMCAFAAAFFVGLLVFTEIVTGSAHETSVTLFKRGSHADIVQDAQKAVGPTDEEKAASDGEADGQATQTREGAVQETKEVLKEQEPMRDVFTWQHLNYEVPVQGGRRKLLEDVSGYVIPGKLTALMGESGAGKTTLLNVLAQRTTTGVVTGDRLVNGHPLPIDFQGQTGYCQQMDTHLSTATVREALLFSAKMRQPASVPTKEKEEYVEQVLKMCGLEAFAEASVGSLGVEHRKRTTIGVELAAKPRLLLFLDEPTSGLDSQSAWAIVTFLRNLADSGQAILCTIHQPSAELFQVFDRLLLLQKGGKTVYFGDLGHHANTLIKYFERNGARTCDPEENPAEFMLDIIGAGATATVDRDWHEIWKSTPECAAAQEEVDRIVSDGQKKPPVQEELHSEYATSWGYQVSELCKRGFLNAWRDPTYLMAKLVLNICGGLFIGFTFFKAKDSIQGTQDKLFAIYMATIISAPLSNQLQVPFIDMRTVFEVREQPSRMYSWTALITSQLLVELPWNILGSSLFFLCWYWTVAFPTSRGGYTYLVLGVAFPFYYTTFASAVAAMSANAEIAAILFSFLFSFVLTFNGVLQPFSQLGWWQWMYHVSPYTYVIGGLLGQAIGHEEIDCSSQEFVTLDPPSGQTCSGYLDNYIKEAGGYLSNPDATSSCQFCSSRTTDQFLGPSFNIYYSQHWRNFGIFCAFIVFNVFLVFGATYFFRIRQGSLLGSLRSRIAARKAAKKTQTTSA